VELIRRAAPLHDVGKIAIPDSILLKPGKLTPEEFEQMKTHTRLGAQMLSGGRFPLLQLAEQVALTHHERWDGTGYLGLCEEAIPIAGRIVTVADVFDALMSERPYKRAWSLSEALAEIKRQSGQQFDPCVVQAFLKAVDH
jgi:putative two-component system response regulator